MQTWKGLVRAYEGSRQAILREFGDPLDADASEFARSFLTKEEERFLADN